MSVFKCCPIGETLNSNHDDIETGLFQGYLAVYRLSGTCSPLTAALLTRLETPHSPKIVLRQLYSQIQLGYDYPEPPTVRKTTLVRLASNAIVNRSDNYKVEPLNLPRCPSMMRGTESLHQVLQEGIPLGDQM